MLFRRKLVMFGPREVLLTSDEPVVRQFLNGRRIGPIGMSEEKDEATMAEEQAQVEAGHHTGGVEEVEGVPPQITATPACPNARQSRVVRRGSAQTCTCCPRAPRKRSSTRWRAPTSTRHTSCPTRWAPAVIAGRNVDRHHAHPAAVTDSPAPARPSGRNGARQLHDNLARHHLTDGRKRVSLLGSMRARSVETPASARYVDMVRAR
ncbi:sulfate/thiosulfate ABC superfamily ATP binding cassette transporter, ABC domain protein [Mycobacterium xenopi 4042]|uniref:Sulfate/thiosulfate ABC superfamily ATP binding cassette transporter, ABC domain protein n=1 Tax=Mycobacterium xenopi 4042 TaxID=1299334 RepID=X7YK88_MYCXE|nr:sulfate/thiosulfate ABC superfamily ATP binding cassette transporter, ABC domain protein [Mycobacterium xenopi 4042]